MSEKLLLPSEKIKKFSNKPNYPALPVNETLTNGFFTVDNKWTVQYWNKAAESILKVAAEDIVGKNLWQKFEGIIPIEFYSIDQRSFLKDVPVHFHEYWGEMGAWFDVITYHCDNTLSVSFKSSNHPHTSSNNPEDRLRVLTELYRFVTEITNDCLWEWDLQAKDIFWIDGGHKRVFGYQVENALIPQNFWESLIHPEDKERVLNSLKKTLTRQHAPLWVEKYRFKTADGNYLYVEDRGHIIYDEDGKATRMIGATKDVTKNVLLEDKLKLERTIKHREITNAVLKSQEKERQLIATELNENLNQLLVAAKWNIQIAKKDSTKMEACLNNSVEYLNNVIAEIRRIYKTLIIPDKDIFSLFDNTRNLVEEFNRIHPVVFSFNEKGIDEEEDLTKNMQVDIFRIIQEQLNNIIIHARATQASINLSRVDNEIILHIADNGIGGNAPAEKNGFGIINIKSRAELYDGTITIASKPGKGYTLKVVLRCCPANT